MTSDHPATDERPADERGVDESRRADEPRRADTRSVDERGADEHGGSRIFTDRGIGILLTVLSAVGLLAAWTLMYDEIEVLKNPDYVPACNFSLLMSCKSVMLSEQGEVFGFPNPMMGMVGFALVLAIAVAAAAGTRFPRWYWAGLLAGLTFGFVMVNWFAYQSIFVMNVLCPWCMVVWTITVPAFWYTLLHVGRKFSDSRLIRGLQAWHALPVVIWYLAVVTAIFVWFWDYYWADFFLHLFS